MILIKEVVRKKVVGLYFFFLVDLFYGLYSNDFGKFGLKK